MASSLSQQTIFPIKAILIFSFLLIFLNQFADCNQDESKLYQILSNALSSCNTAEVFNIINCDIDPNVTDTSGISLLMAATIVGCKDIGLMLLESGADPDLQDNAQRTALYYAVMHGNHSMAEMLLEKGASVNLADSNRETVLIKAVEKADSAMVLCC